MTSRQLTVVNQLGLHARAAAKFVHLATRFEARIQVARNARQMDGKSIMGLLLLAAACGSMITITADGPDEAAAIEALSALVQSGFGEERSPADSDGSAPGLDQG
jgi:phosphocarrier protein HPr